MDTIQHRWVYLICGGMVLAGAALFWHGLGIPVYTDQALASSLKMACWNGDHRSLTELGDAVRSLRTARHDFMQGGLSLGLAAVTMAELFRFYPACGGRGIATPETPRALVRLGVLAAAIIWGATLQANSLDVARGDVIDCGGPTAAAVFFGIIIAGLIFCLFVYFVGKLIASRFIDEKVSLLFWDSKQQFNSFVSSAVFGGLAVFSIWLGMALATTSTFAATPACIILAYVFLSSRAAWVASAGIDR